MSHDFEASRLRSCRICSDIPGEHQTISAMGDIASLPDKTGRDP
jgi:hypothetical protein